MQRLQNCLVLCEFPYHNVVRILTPRDFRSKGPECQKAKWKEHKVKCRKEQKAQEILPEILLKYRAAMITWEQRNLQPLSWAGNHALLRHKDTPSQHLFDTHLLRVRLKAIPSSSSKHDLEVDFARVRPLEDLRTTFPPGPEGDAEHKAALEKARQLRTATAKADGRVCVGTMWILLEYMGIPLTVPFMVSQEAVDVHARHFQKPNWEEELKRLAALKGDQLYRTDDSIVVQHRASRRA